MARGITRSGIYDTEIRHMGKLKVKLESSNFLHGPDPCEGVRSDMDGSGEAVKRFLSLLNYLYTYIYINKSSIKRQY
jgi:hypothetical protein